LIKLEYMLKCFLLCFLLIVMWYAQSCAPQTAAENESIITYKTHPLSHLQEDFKQLQQIIETEHHKLFTDIEELHTIMKSQYILIEDGMEEHEFYRIIAPIITALNCGHTYMHVSDGLRQAMDEQGRFLPLVVKVIQNRVYVYKSLNLPAVSDGTEIISINGRPVRDIISVFLHNIPSDGANTSMKYFMMNKWFNIYYIIFIESPKTYKIIYMPMNGVNKQEAVLIPLVGEQYKNKMDEIFKGQDNEYYDGAFKKDYAVLNINSFNFYDTYNTKKFWEFLGAFFADIREKKIEHLILDLRDNGGGNPDNSAYLFRYLISKALAYSVKDAFPRWEYLKDPLEPFENNFTGRLYILINGGCFSSTGHLCSLLKYHDIGVFIGQETGGSFAAGSMYNDVLFFNTQIRFHYSRSVSETAVSGLKEGRGIMPDYVIIPTIKDYIMGKDPEMEYAFGLINMSIGN
jgi:hypothetical protein